MTLRKSIVLILGIHLGVVISAGHALAQRRITTTLLPAKAESTPAAAGDMLKISANGNDPIQATSTVLLTFDPASIPKDAVISAATLRMVGKSNAPNPQFVQITSGSDDSIGQWTAAPGKTVFSAPSDSLRRLVADNVKSREPFALKLTSKSRLSDWDYYALSKTAYPSSSKPRLIVEYTDPTQLPAGLDTTTRTSWTILHNTSEITDRPFLKGVTLSSNPAFFQGNAAVLGNPSSQKTSLYYVAPGGTIRSTIPISEVPGEHTAVSSNGRFFAVGAKRILLYDLQQQGAQWRSITVPDLTLNVPPVLGADGSLFFVRSGYGSVYGLNPGQDEIWRYPATDNAGAATVSPITLSPVAQRYAYLLTRRENKNALVRIDATDGSADVVSFNDKYTGFHRPVVVPGPEQDYVIVAAYNQSDGTLSAYSGGDLRWEKNGPVSQPIADLAGKQVFAVQDGKFRAYDILNGSEVCTAPYPKESIAATSNLVTDAYGMVYFWNNGHLYVFNRNCQPIVDRPIANLPKNLELMFAQDGTLYARTETQQLFSLTFFTNSWVVDPTEVKTNTVYAAGTLGTANNVSLKKDMNVIFKAEKGIGFGPTFSVAKGAKLRCQIGF